MSAAPRLTDPRSFAFILVGIPLPLLISLVTKSWASGRGDTIAVGPLGAEVCVGASCASGTFKQLGMGSEVGALGALTIVTAILAMVAAGLFGGLVLARKEDKLPSYLLGHATFGAAALCSLLFALRVGGGDEVSISWGPLFALASVGVGWYMLRRLQTSLPARVAAQPVAALFGEVAQAPVAATSTPAAAPATMAATPATPANQPSSCPKCKGPIDFIPQYQRSWCAKCRQYA